MAFVICALFVLILAGPAAAETGGAKEELKVENGQKITVDVENKSLSALLRMMADKKLFDLSGRQGGANEPLTLHFSKLTLSEALSKMMRGYSYVLVDEGKGRPVLTVLGKADRDAPSPDRQQRPRGTPPDQGANSAAGPLPPVQQRQPLTPPPPQQAAQQPPPGGQQQTTQQPAPGEQPAQAGRPQQPVQQQAQQPAQPQATGGQPVQGGQQAPGSQQAPAAPAPPPEPEGVHF